MAARRTRHLLFTWPAAIEWPTVGLFVLCAACWIVGVFLLGQSSLAIAFGLTIFSLVLHSSLTHEALHGHPFPSRLASEALVLINPALFIPYLRFRDQHLAHHQDARLTDPYDDPESNYLDPAIWHGLARPLQVLLQFNNTLLGRILLGPAIGLWVFMKNDIRAMRGGDWQVRKGWLLHLPGLALTLWAISLSTMPIGLYVVACYAALSILKIRTFLEHQAHECARGRTVIIEDRGLLAFLFLNNNLHVVHHVHPRVPWYRLRALYALNRDHYLQRNEGYLYRSYGEVLRRHLLKSKDPVAHPLWQSP
ncbi:MAG: fatty acid desaturase [Pseudomonadota bacterium]